jgi:hypothetical protein
MNKLTVQKIATPVRKPRSVKRVWENVVRHKRPAVAERVAQNLRQDARHFRPLTIADQPVRLK